MRWLRAPAKLNLALRVVGRRADGYHEVESLVAFAGLCDWLGFDPGDRGPGIILKSRFEWHWGERPKRP